VKVANDPANKEPSNRSATLVEAADAKTPSWLRVLVPCSLTLYAFLVTAANSRHERWADEAQAWLLARDSSLLDLWTGLLRYEGTPGLWHTLLHALTSVGLPYEALGIVSGGLGIAGAWLLLRYAPFPLWVRVTLPFTFFLLYQYAVIARSYSLLPPLLFSCAAIFHDGGRRIALFTTLCCLTAAVSVHGFVLSICIWISCHYELARRWRTLAAENRRRVIIAAVLYGTTLLMLALSAWPAQDVTFPYRRDFSLDLLMRATGTTVREAFAGNLPLSVFIVALSMPFLWRGGGLLVFALATAVLCGLAAFVHTQLWHLGILFLAWVAALWIAANRTSMDKAARAALILVVVIQTYWAVRSIQYDWKHAYSGSLAAATYVQPIVSNRHRIFFGGYSSTAVRGYLPVSLSYLHEGVRSPAYWRWSAHNEANDPKSVFSAPSPDYVVIGYTAADERRRWSSLLDLGGYKRVRNFEGSLFWRTKLLEAESFDVYQRGSGSVPLPNKVSVADAKMAAQLIDGFYGIESNTWRWTARDFSVLLGAPARARDVGALLVLRLFIPESHIGSGSARTLTGFVGDHELAPAAYTDAGGHVYSRYVPPEFLDGPTVRVRFSFDRALPGSAADGRELSAIVTEIGLLPQ
jgi:hypothetical protein